VSDDLTPAPDPTELTFRLVDRETAHLVESIRHLKELVDLQFALTERQRVESKVDIEKALAVALASRESATGVLATTTSTSIEEIRKDIAGLRERAKQDEGGQVQRARGQASVGLIAALVFGALGILVAFLGLVATVVTIFLSTR
jgi:hypothetical protein